VKRQRQLAQGAFLLVALCLVGGVIHGVPRDSDYEIFLRSGLRLRAGAAIFEPADGLFPFKYHPTVALFWALWSHLPTLGAKTFFLIGQTALTTTMIGAWTLRVFGRENFRWAFPSAMLVAKKLIWRDLDLGQTNGMLYLGASAATALALTQSKSPSFLAGAIITGITLVKLNYGLLSGLGLLASPVAFGAGAVFVAVLAAAVTCMWFGFADGLALHTEWIGLLLSASEAQLTDQENQGLLHALSALWPTSARALWLAATGAFALAGWTIIKRRPLDHQAAYWLFGVNVLSPLAWWNQYVLAIPMLLVAWRDRRNPLQTAVLGAVVFWCVIFHYDVVGHTVFNESAKHLVPFFMLASLFVVFSMQRDEIPRYARDSFWREAPETSYSARARRSMP